MPARRKISLWELKKKYRIIALERGAGRRFPRGFYEGTRANILGEIRGTRSEFKSLGFDDSEEPDEVDFLWIKSFLRRP